MKVDLGNCVVCGAKNSKFVQECYKCGAPLPWSPNFQPPAGKPASTPAPPVSTPSNPAPSSPKSAVPPVSAPRADAQTVFVPPPATLPATPGAAPDKPPSPFPIKLPQQIPERVHVPTWAIAAGVLGCIVLGMLLVTVFHREPQSYPPQQAMPVATAGPTLAATAAPTAGGTAAPTAAATPGVGAPGAATPAAITPATLTPAAATPGAGATPAPTVSAAGASPAPTGETTSPAPTTSVTTAAPVPASAPRVGPSFQEVDAKINDRTGKLTEAQKQIYWQGVAGSTVTWTGDTTQVDVTGGGHVSFKCGPATTPSTIEVSLDGSQLQKLPGVNKGQHLTVQGILKGRGTSSFTLEQGRVVSFG